MGEPNRQVRVDNWGVFFLQRLQVFFNKTDYCDLTLQFEGNVQLKVHRLVMSACTEYFSILEHTCEIIDGNIIIMPDDLQADVILPIVNFMYTGMLEFPMSIFDKLYRTAELMNIPILVKLLDAQRKPIKTLRKQRYMWPEIKKQSVNNKDSELPATLPGRKLPIWKRKSIGTPPPRTASPQLFSSSITENVVKRTPPDPLAIYDNTPKPTRFEWPEEDLNTTFNLMDTSFNDISYTSKPLLTQDDELRASTSFDELKYSANMNSTKQTKDYESSIDLNEDIKDFTRERKPLQDSGEYEEEDEDDPDNYLVERDNKRKLSRELSPTHAKKVRFTINEKENKEMTISVTPKNPGEVDHTKIISEVLKRYPHLVKKNKNIKLKIMAKSAVRDPPKVPSVIKPLPPTMKVKVLSPKESPKPIKAVATKLVKPQPEEGPWVCKKCSFSSTEPVEFVLYYLYRKHMTDVHHERFDSKMCKHCGHQSSKNNLLMYHQYTKHGVKPPAAYNFPKCPRCPFIALTENLLQKHLQSVHSKYDSQCTECKVAFNSQSSLEAHMQITGHSNSGRSSFDCQYCTKRYNSASDLFGHIRGSHRDEARKDGIVSIDETGDMDEEQENEDDEFLPREEIKKTKKIEVVANIKIEEVKPPLVVQPQNAPGIISSEIITDMEGSNQGIVDIVVLDENQQYILHNDQQLVHTQQSMVHSQPEYILPDIKNEHEYTEAQHIQEVIATSQANVITQSMLQSSEIASTDELVMVLTDHDYNDANNSILTNENSNIVVLYSHPVDGQQSEFITSEGKLILNPQTGLLELRNDNTDSQDTQIESIELIQREINNGLMQQAVAEVEANQIPLTTDDNYKDNAGIGKGEEIDEKPEIEAIEPTPQQYQLPQNLEPVEQNVQLPEPPIEQQMEIDETCNVEENNLDGVAPIVEEVPIEPIVQHQHSGDEIMHEFHNDQERMVDDLATQAIQNEELHSERFENVTEGTTTSPMEVEDEINQEILNQEQKDIPKSPQENNIATEINSEEATTEMSSERQDEEENVEKPSDDPVSEDPQATTKICEDEKSKEHVMTAEVLKIPQEMSSELPYETSMQDTSTTFHVQHDTHPEISQDKCSEEVDQPAEMEEIQLNDPSEIIDTSPLNKMNLSPEVASHIPENLPTEHVNEGIENTSPTIREQTEPSNDVNQDNVNVLSSESPNNVSNNPHGVMENQISESDKEHKDQTSLGDQNPIAEITDILTEDNVNVHKELTMKMDFEVDSNRRLEEQPQNYEDMTMLIDNSTQENKKDISEDDKKEMSIEDATTVSPTIEYEIEKEPTDVEEEGSVDENSQSQDSQTSQSSKEPASDCDKQTANESTKTLILNDWEDTEDSQQSDNPEKNIENTVNKLIDDWDDDDEEGQAMGT